MPEFLPFVVLQMDLLSLSARIALLISDVPPPACPSR